MVEHQKFFRVRVLVRRTFWECLTVAQNTRKFTKFSIYYRKFRIVTSNIQNCVRITTFAVINPIGNYPLYVTLLMLVRSFIHLYLFVAK